MNPYYTADGNRLKEKVRSKKQSVRKCTHRYDRKCTKETGFDNAGQRIVFLHIIGQGHKQEHGGVGDPNFVFPGRRCKQF